MSITYLPNTQNELINDFEIKEIPTRTYALKSQYNRLYSFVEGLDAVKQAIYLILNTERYEHLIYSWNYGVELADLFGKPISYAMSEIKRRISEALLQDDRITDVGEFEFESKRSELFCKFKVYTIYGEVDAEKAVNV